MGQGNSSTSSIDSAVLQRWNGSSWHDFQVLFSFGKALCSWKLGLSAWKVNQNESGCTTPTFWQCAHVALPGKPSRLGPVGPTPCQPHSRCHLSKSEGRISAWQLELGKPPGAFYNPSSWLRLPLLDRMQWRIVAWGRPRAQIGCTEHHLVCISP